MYYLTSYFLIAILFYIEYHYEYSRITTTIQISGDDGGSTRFLVLSCLLSLVVSPCWEIFVPIATIGTVAPWIGISCMMVAMILLRWTMLANPFYLRAMATTDDQLICTNGPYRYIRHPGYLSFLLGWIGFGLTVNNWIALLMIFVLFTVVYKIRIQAEEQMMLDRFGAGYQHYMDETLSF
ncbi:uncharacterized protein B0P05DRAFT_531520 [Gilbertella persicaria]|uniref:uncharacterized protein n=1 Tax=Gilbertella persicaria TaxID=101096 RepID=UPI00221E6113|nr:uncharacterized protein B0P05DRAFT_531520 [Gilbertella persicaria]KAI8087579.1 hypothetical protein B0P05DRAFT_531520 [Gilbertella persicaria]